MRNAIERQQRERRIAAIVFVLLLGVVAVSDGWRAIAGSESATPTTARPSASTTANR